jgi:hypothetical protein
MCHSKLLLYSCVLQTPYLTHHTETLFHSCVTLTSSPSQGHTQLLFQCFTLAPVMCITPRVLCPVSHPCVRPCPPMCYTGSHHQLCITQVSSYHTEFLPHHLSYHAPLCVSHQPHQPLMCHVELLTLVKLCPSPPCVT